LAVKLADIFNGSLVKMKEVIIVAGENKLEAAWLRRSKEPGWRWAVSRTTEACHFL